MFEGQAALEADLEQLSDERFCQSGKGIARELRSLLLPPENISTRDCAARYRYLPNPEGTGKRLYDPSLTPYMDGPQDALDDGLYRFVIVVGPGRTGKSVAGENHLFKRLRHGPLTDTILYLPGKTDVDSYADKEFAEFFTLHPEIAAKLGTRTTDNKRNFKRVAGRAIQLFPANPGTVRQKQAPLIMATEVDGYRKVIRAAMKSLIAIRGRAFGNQFKGYIESHPDAGFTGGIAGFWQESTRGLWYWPCAHCGDWSSPHPLARKGMHMRLTYERPSDMADDDMLNRVAETAGLLCPHCGTVNGDADKTAMLAKGTWIFDGQIIAPDGTVTGAVKPNDSAGFWIHGTMSPFVSLGTLAKEYVGALVLFERTKKSERLREVTAKSLGEVYEGGAGRAAIDATKLAERAAAVAEVEGFDLCTVPDGPLFATAAVDVGGSNFDCMICGWDLEGRCWILDRWTIYQRMVKGRMQGIRPAERQDDWLVLRDEVLNRVLPLQRDPTKRLPVAAMAIDTGDGHVTWKAREFARRMARAKQYWGSAAAPWHKVRLIKGSRSAVATELPAKGREVSVDENGRKVLPTVLEWDLGVHKLKTLSIERLAQEEDGPGFVRFANDLPHSTFAEFAGEVLIDDVWERRGPNESLDLLGYNEAVRLMLRPERADINWLLRPVWARPVPIVTEIETTSEPAATPEPKKQSALDRMAALNRR
jgi:phage terminase large subunit GpA-like protein